MFGKRKKKLDRRMRRRIRKTSAVMLLISAITVAAIPVPEAAAANDGIVTYAQEPTAAELKNSVYSGEKDGVKGIIPEIGTTDNIYASEDSRFTFAYVKTTDYGDKAVLLSCAGGPHMTNLEIPQTVNAYIQYTTTDGSSRAFAAANQNGDVLYYKMFRIVTAVRTQNGVRGTQPGDTGWSTFTAETVNYALEDKNTNYQTPTVSTTFQATSGTNDPNDPGVWSQTVRYWEYYFVPCRQGEEGTWNNDSVQRYLYNDAANYPTPPAGQTKPSPENMRFYQMPTLPTGVTPNDFIADTEHQYIDVIAYPAIFNIPGNNEDWLVNAQVGFISDQRTEYVGGALQLASGKRGPEESFFPSGQMMITVNLPDTLVAIADYSFYNCSSLQSVTFDGTSTISAIGSNAFANCSSMTTFSLASNAPLAILSDSVFARCGRLQSFTVPVGVTRICDDAFADCFGLGSVDFSNAANLTRMGSRVFQNCSSLAGVELPNSLTDMGQSNFAGCSSLQNVVFPDNPSIRDISFTNFRGCSSLECIDVPNNNTTFKYKEGTNDYYEYGPEQFKNDVSERFYFIGNNGTQNCQVHNLTTEEAFAFKYRNEDRYEKVIREYGTDSQGNVDKGNIVAEYNYQVDSNGELLWLGITRGNPETVVIERTIGPHDVKTIGSQFSNNGQGNDTLRSITIPNTITEIGDNAFKGCKNLEEVIFIEPNNIQSIGTDAFKTQEGSNTTITELTFYGKIDIDSVPFMYAMQRENNYNSLSQDRAYIDFCSSDGTNIHVMYNYNTGKREVIHVPTTDIAWAGVPAGTTVENMEKLNKKGNTKYQYDYYLALRKALLEMNSPLYTEDNVDAEITNLVRAYEGGSVSGNDSPSGNLPTTLSEDAMKVFRSAYDITLPSGIQSIKSGLFSNADEETTTTGDDPLNELSNRPISIPAAVWDKGASRPFNANQSIRSIVMDDVEALEPYTFYGCENLNSVEMYSSEAEGGESIGNYTFGHCPELATVKLPYSTTEMGKRPFAADKKLTEVRFVGEEPLDGVYNESNQGDNFLCDRGVIYGLRNGAKDSVVQCLESRGVSGGVGSSRLVADELAGVRSIAEEAFMNCKGLDSVELGSSSVTRIPKFCFSDAENLRDAKLPSTCTVVDDYAFKDTALHILRVPNMLTNFASYAFYDTDDNGHVKDGVEVETMEGSSAAILAETYKDYHWVVSDNVIGITCTTIFQDRNGHVIAEHRNEEGEDVEEPTEEEWAAYFEAYPDFAGMAYEWLPENFSPASKETNYVTATFLDEVTYYHVRFVNDNLTVIMEEDVLSGKRTPVPQTPTSAQNPGASFRGWLSDPQGVSPYDPITCDVTFMASYNSGNGGNSGDQSGNNPNDPNNPNGGNNGNNGNNSNNGNNGNNGTNGDSNSNKQRYTLTVVNGSGSGDYEEGTTVVIAAFEPNTGYAFYNWTSSESDTAFASKTMSATTFKMPKKNLTVTANYRVKSETGNAITSRRSQGTITSSPASNTGSVSKSNGNSNSNNNNNSGSSVQVSRPGISDTNVASATVNGSTDNFVVKVTEDGQATMAVAEALRNEYGDLTNIHYFAMDISLYDETGTKKITDTTGLSVTITLPLPDELRQYGGNNKVAAVTGGNNLDKLNPRFTTVNGVPCVTFTATHFSPYTVYVDTANLSEGAYDITPKTGDAIHPKWFLAIGLALFSAVLFLKKDKKVNPGIA